MVAVTLKNSCRRLLRQLRPNRGGHERKKQKRSHILVLLLVISLDYMLFREDIFQ